MPRRNCRWSIEWVRAKEAHRRGPVAGFFFRVGLPSGLPVLRIPNAAVDSLPAHFHPAVRQSRLQPRLPGVMGFGNDAVGDATPRPDRQGPGRADGRSRSRGCAPRPRSVPHGLRQVRALKEATCRFRIISC
jgi:hypothetical protein